MLPRLRERLDVTPRATGDIQEDRWRLMQAATDLLRNAAAQHPLLLVLEDLQDADSGTLDLLLYLARNLHGARLLVIGTYRDIEVDRAHPLSTALTELHKVSNFARIHLRGLTRDDVLRVLAETSQQRVPLAFAELVHRRTDGNPLFVHEVLRYVLVEGLVERRDGALRRVGNDSLAGQIPEGLRDVVVKRLSRLSETTSRVLGVAAVIGRQFQLEILERVLACPEEEVERALEEARAAGIIEERAVLGTAITYRFSHAYFQQTLYDETLAPDGSDSISRSREPWNTSIDANSTSTRLAGGTLSPFRPTQLISPKQSITVQLAARRATEVFVYGEAAHHMERASMVKELASTEDSAKRCELLLALGEALVAAGEPGRVLAQVAPDARVLAGAFERTGPRVSCLQAGIGVL